MSVIETILVQVQQHLDSSDRPAYEALALLGVATASWVDWREGRRVPTARAVDRIADRLGLQLVATESK